MVNLLDFLGPHGNTLPSKFDDNHGSILVTDAQGVVGYRVANKLLATGYPSVKVGLRDTSLAAEFKKNGAHIVQFDFDKPETFLHALEGVHKVYFSAPHHENWEEKFDAFLKAAKTRKVEHIVKLSICHSFYKNDPFTKVPLVKMHREMDKSLAKHGSPNYTILLASHFMSNPTVYQEDILRKEHRFVGASGAKGVAYVSPNDVADLAARALLAPGDYKRKMIHVTGPELITDTQVAEILTYSLNTKITFEDKPLELFREEARSTDWGPAVDVMLLERVKSSGYEENGFVSNDVQKHCGHPGETFAEYVENHGSMTPKELAFLKP